MIMEGLPATQTLAEIMITRVVTVEMDDSLEVVRAIFQKVKFHHLLVVENEKVVGVISERDLLMAISPFVGTISETSRDLSTLDRRAHQIMSHHPVMIHKSATIQDAGERMLKRGVSCLPVISTKGTIDGIVTWKDLVKAFLQTSSDPKAVRT